MSVIMPVILTTSVIFTKISLLIRDKKTDTAIAAVSSKEIFFTAQQFAAAQKAPVLQKEDFL